MFGSKFAPYCLQNTVLNCAAVMGGLAWGKTQIKVDCRHKPGMHQLVTSSVSCYGHHAPLGGCEYHNSKFSTLGNARGQRQGLQMAERERQFLLSYCLDRLKQS